MPVFLSVFVVKLLSLDTLNILCSDRFVLLIRILKDLFQSFRDLMFDLAASLSFHVKVEYLMMQKVSTLIRLCHRDMIIIDVDSDGSISIIVVHIFRFFC